MIPLSSITNCAARTLADCTACTACTCSLYCTYLNTVMVQREHLPPIGPRWWRQAGHEEGLGVRAGGPPAGREGGGSLGKKGEETAGGGNCARRYSPPTVRPSSSPTLQAEAVMRRGGTAYQMGWKWLRLGHKETSSLQEAWVTGREILRRACLDCSILTPARETVIQCMCSLGQAKGGMDGWIGCPFLCMQYGAPLSVHPMTQAPSWTAMGCKEALRRFARARTG